MAADVDHYRTLGVDPSSEDVVIQAAYRALMRRYHPDTNSNPEAIGRSQTINAAYAILSDPERRSAYDRTRAARGGASGTPPPPPPPQDEPPASAADSGLPASMKNGPGSVVAYGAVVGICILAAVIINLPAGASTENTMNLDETLTSENVVSDDTSAFDTMAMADANMVVDGITMDANAMTPMRPTLATVPQQSVKFDSIEAASKHFASILMDRGIEGARTYSTQCHEKVVESPSWSGADYCAAFDFAAAYVDRQIAAEVHVAPNSYFKFQSDNQKDNYTDAGAPDYSVALRLMSIKQSAELAAADAVETAIARNKEQREAQAASKAVEGLSAEDRANAKRLQEQREAQYDLDAH
jgi:hypothetical protein